MAEDNKKKNNKKNPNKKPRQVTKEDGVVRKIEQGSRPQRQVTRDSKNASVNKGLRPERATINFTFEKVPDSDFTASFKKDASFGLPESYSEPEKKPEAEKPEQTAAETNGNAAGGFDAAMEKLKNKFNERKEAAKAARAAAIERKRERAKEEAIAKAARDAEAAKKAEAARLAAEAAQAEAKKKAEEAALEEAVQKAAEEQTSAETKKAEKPQAAPDSEKEAVSPVKAGAALAARLLGIEDRSGEQKPDSADKSAGKSDKKTENKAEKKDAAKSGDGKAGTAGKKTAKAGAAKKGRAVKSATKKAGGQSEAKAAAKTQSKPKKQNKQKKKAAKKAKPKGKFRWLFATLKVIVVLILVTGIAVLSYVGYTIAHAPTIHPENLYSTLDISTHIYDDDGDLVDEIYYSENRELVTYDQLPENLKNAFIAIEDKTFWEHRGFNFRRIIGAVINSLRGGGEISGTSTITQQLARNVYLPEEKSIRSIKRKIIEMYYAYEIEEVLSKEEILTAYLNTIYLGYGCYGVDTAAKQYFSSEIGDLTLEQCAALAALPQAPGVYALVVTEKGEDGDDTVTKIRKGVYANDISAERRYMVLDLMAEQGYITPEEAATAKIPLTEFIKPSKANKNAKSSFKDYLIETVISDLMNQYGLTEDQATKMVYTKGLNIYSTLDSQAQKVITEEFKNKASFPSALKENAKVEAAMVITEVGTGEIKAMCGTRDASGGEMLFNRAVSPRQPGSSIKPIAVYAPALQKSYEYEKEGEKFQFVNTGYDSQGTRLWGDYITAMSTVRDEKMTVNGKVWPQNFSRTYTGYKNFRTAIQQSINTCAVKILAQVGVDYSMETVKRFGITTVVDDTSEPYNDVNLAALGLGAMTVGVTPLEMSLAYATFPNGGVRNSGICYTKVTDSEGKVLLEGKSEETKVLDEGVAFIMTDVLQTVVSHGIAYNAAISGEKVGGKTGTTDQTWDIWFDGFTPKYSASLWIGTDDNTTLNTTSNTAAALWSRIMSQVKGAKGGEYRSKPDNVILTRGEYYTKGTEPAYIPPAKTYHSSKKEPDPNEGAQAAGTAQDAANQNAGADPNAQQDQQQNPQ